MTLPVRTRSSLHPQDKHTDCNPEDDSHGGRFHQL